MRVRLGLIIATVLAALLSPIAPQALAFGGYASAPTSVSQTAIAGGIRVTWSAPTDIDTGITGYRVEYSTSGTSGTWTLWATVGSSTYTSDILGLSQVATYVRVAGTTTAGIGAYGYPWREVYRTLTPKRASNNETIIYDTGFGLGVSDAAAVLNNTTSFTRVKYHMEATVNSTSSYADTDFYKWSGASITTLQVPTVGTSSSAFVVQTNVTDLNVYSNNSNVTKANGISGRLELWGWNYDIPKASDYANGDSAKYDYNDTSNGNGTFGSFQVHDITNFKTVFAWNYHHYTGSDNPNIGFGNNSSSSGHPDWTFCVDSLAQGPCVYTSNTFKLQIFINLSVTPLADSTPPTVTRVDAKNLIKLNDTISVQSNEIGTVYLVRNSVTVTNLASITGAASNVRKSVSITSVNTPTTLTASLLLDGTYNLYAADSAGNISSGIISTLRLDATSPFSGAISVDPAGNTISLAVTETVTFTNFDSSAYTVSDSGSALSVTGATSNGLLVTFYLSRVIPQGAYVTFSYQRGNVSAESRWIDAAGNEMNQINLGQITNYSTNPISLSFSITNPLYKGVSTTISISAGVAGKVTFTLAGKRIVGCLNKIATGTTPITVNCTFKPAISGRQEIAAVLVPTLGNLATTTTKVERFILKRSTLR